MDTTTHHPTHRPPPPPPRNHQRRKREESLKVVYISTPMKVRTSAARFRSLVQHLTGKNSDIAPYMDADGGAVVDYRDEDGTLLPDRIPSSVSSDETAAAATTAAATSDTGDNVFASQFEDQFRGFFSSEMDVLGSYEDLIM